MTQSQRLSLGRADVGLQSINLHWAAQVILMQVAADQMLRYTNAENA